MKKGFQAESASIKFESGGTISLQNSKTFEIRARLTKNYDVGEGLALKYVSFLDRCVEGATAEVENQIYKLLSICMEKGVTLEELKLLKTAFDNKLESASKPGMNVIDYGESVAINQEKRIEDRELFHTILFEPSDENNEFSTLTSEQDIYGSPSISPTSLQGVDTITADLDSFEVDGEELVQELKDGYNVRES